MQAFHWLQINVNGIVITEIDDADRKPTLYNESNDFKGYEEYGSILRNVPISQQSILG